MPTEIVENEGTVKWTYEKTPKVEFTTHYTTLGDPKSPPDGAVPLVILHGGPAIANPYLSPHKVLHEKKHLNGAPLIFYDQIGGGKSVRPHSNDKMSAHIPEPAEFYTVDLFIAELEVVLKHFGLHEKEYDLYGHSWGGMLAADFVSAKAPKNLRKLILAGAPASMELFEKSVMSLLDKDDNDHKKIRALLEQGKEEEATTMFYNLHLCSLEGGKEWPQDLQAAFDKMMEDPVVYITM
jgi:proline-specific peptidase